MHICDIHYSLYQQTVGRLCVLFLFLASVATAMGLALNKSIVFLKYQNA